MEKKNIAILLTVYNRKDKTIRCLSSLFKQQGTSSVRIKVYLVDDGCTDGTFEEVSRLFPEVKILKGTGSLYWAGGMRYAWNEALHGKYDGYLLINDDTYLYPKCIELLLETDSHAIDTYGKHGIYIGSTKSSISNELTYGGSKLLSSFSDRSKRLEPDKVRFMECELGNANIMYVCSDVVTKIGILSKDYTHGIADYDYTLMAIKRKIPVIIARDFCGECDNDHGRNWKSSDYKLSERIAYMKSPLGLAYNEYLHYIRKHFPYYVLLMGVKLWIKTLFPFIWDKWKK